MKNMAVCEKPREKFLVKGAEALSDNELLAILLRTGVKGRSVIDVSRDVIQSLPAENLYYLGETTVSDLKRIHGIGADKAVTVCAAVELGKRISRQQVKQIQPDFSSPEAVANYVMADMRVLHQERFAAAYLNMKNRLITCRTLSIGTINASIAKSREVFSYALRYNAASIVLIHNHPSGDPEPSREDIAVTQRISEAGRVLEIPVLDHIIIGDGVFVSLCERGYL